MMIRTMIVDIKPIVASQEINSPRLSYTYVVTAQWSSGVMSPEREVGEEEEFSCSTPAQSGIRACGPSPHFSQLDQRQQRRGHRHKGGSNIRGLKKKNTPPSCNRTKGRELMDGSSYVQAACITSCKAPTFSCDEILEPVLHRIYLKDTGEGSNTGQASSTDDNHLYNSASS